MALSGHTESVAIEDLTSKQLVWGPGRLKAVAINNGLAAISYVQLFNAAAVGDVTVGTTEPNLVIPATLSAIVMFTIGGDGLYFNLGVVAAGTTDWQNSTAVATGLNVSFVF